MTLQYAVALNNAKLDQITTTIGTAAVVRIYSGSEPANCAAGATGTKLTEDSLPSTYMLAAASASKAKTGTWTLNGIAGAGTGTAAGYFRIYDSGIATCYIQGSITVTGGGGDLTMDNTSIANAQVITVNTFTLTAGNQ